MTARKLALVTGASSGIGLELAKCCARDGLDLVIAADEAAIEDAARELRSEGASVEAVEADLAIEAGVNRLLAATGRRPVDVLLANAGRGLGKAFVDQGWAEIRRVIDTNVTGTLYLTHKVAESMRDRGSGRILLTGSIAGFMPGTFQAVYNGTKAFIDSFAIALRHELKDSGVTVTVLMPGPTDTRFFERAGMLDTKVAQDSKDDPAEVARIGYDAMQEGEEQVVSGWKNKLQAAAAHVMPAGMLANGTAAWRSRVPAGDSSRRRCRNTRLGAPSHADAARPAGKRREATRAVLPCGARPRPSIYFLCGLELRRAARVRIRRS